MSHPVNEHTAAWTTPSNGPNLVVLPRTYALVSSLWVQLHATQLHPAPRLSIYVAAAPRHYIRLRLCWSYSARTRLLQCGATPKRQRSRDRWTLPSPAKPPPSVHLVSAATRHRLSSHSPALPLTPPNTLLFSGASPCASVLPYLYIYLTSC